MHAYPSPCPFRPPTTQLKNILVSFLSIFPSTFVVRISSGIDSFVSFYPFRYGSKKYTDRRKKKKIVTKLSQCNVNILLYTPSKCDWGRNLRRYETEERDSLDKTAKKSRNDFAILCKRAPDAYIFDDYFTKLKTIILQRGHQIKCVPRSRSHERVISYAV